MWWYSWLLSLFGITEYLGMVACIMHCCLICNDKIVNLHFLNFRNLHAAIGAYYDFEMPSGKIPSMSFMQDVTIGEGEAVPPDTEFLKTWRIKNNGSFCEKRA